MASVTLKVTIIFRGGKTFGGEGGGGGLFTEVLVGLCVVLFSVQCFQLK